MTDYKKLIVFLFCTILSFFSLAPTVSGASTGQPATPTKGAFPVVGAIRWDAWYQGNDFEKNLAPKEWRHRLPFYAEVSPSGAVSVSSDRQEIMEKEIRLAREAGLDYWAFCYYGVKPGTPMDKFNYGLRRYLAAKEKAGLSFCLVLQADYLGSKKEWRQTIQQLVALFRHPAYQKVMKDRPLVYIFDANKLSAWAGSDDAAKAAFDELDQASVNAGLGEPYVVSQGTSVESNVWLANRFGLDAISAYALPGKGDDVELPYSELARTTTKFWEECKTSAKQIIPIVNAGWDNRPRRTSPEKSTSLRGPWYTQPTPGELAIHLYSAIQWVKNNPAYTEAKTIIVYAWNESDEGGWLVPSLTEGDARLQAVRAALETR